MGALTFPGGESVMENKTVLERTEPLPAVCIEFVAKPEEVHRLRNAIPAAVRDGLRQVPGFVGCLVMISDRECRLVTVITFWTEAERTTCSSRRARRVHKLLIPYVDHCLRVQTLDAYLSGLCSGWGGIVGRESVPQAKTCSGQEL